MKSNLSAGTEVLASWLQRAKLGEAQTHVRRLEGAYLEQAQINSQLQSKVKDGEMGWDTTGLACSSQCLTACGDTDTVAAVCGEQGSCRQSLHAAKTN